MGAFSATNYSENINHHGSLIGIGSGDVPPLCPFVKVVSSKQKAALKAVTSSGFSASNCSENINHHGSLIGIGSGDFPPLCPSVKVVSSKQKAVLKRQGNPTTMSLTGVIKMLQMSPEIQKASGVGPLCLVWQVTWVLFQPLTILKISITMGH